MSTQEIEIATIPQELGRRAERSARGGVNIGYIVAGLVVIGFIAIVAGMSLLTGSYWLTVGELQQGSARYMGERVRVSGDMLAGSEDWNAQEITLRFTVTGENGEQLPIVFFGPRPDNFQRATEAIIEGELLPNGSFQADTLLLKCPSRYEEEPEEVFVESTR